MIKSKNSKNIIFHKVNLKNSKRIERSSQDIPYLQCNYLLNKDNKNSFKSSAIDNILKTIEDKYTVSNKNLISHPRRIKSSKKNISFKVKDLILNQKSKKHEEEEKKNDEEKEMINNLKITTRNEKEKKEVVSNIKRCKTSCNKYNKNKIINNNHGKKELTNNNIIKNKKTKKIKNHEINSNKNIMNEQSEGFVNKKKFKFLCCL